ncbi:hypothetical protein EUGRSUZ_L02766 [Eucalyptus grandis]|uniref:Cobalamin-independent methionine synthase MetE C-terminal/archaeal domain-containing protein n=2 Tax=Eucalyptus TaxID=3932 RepID=A0AAD9WIN9_EUCGR|nr:hypothetical protein EUGRSUZ_L02766 [Eucalyptus grandis]
MDADVITIENSRSDEKPVSVIHKGVEFGTGIGPSVYDIHSFIIPSAEEIADRITKMLATNILWFNPEFVLKTCKHTGVKLALKIFIAAAELLRIELAHAKKEKYE